jgi:hypothetical protein
MSRKRFLSAVLAVATALLTTTIVLAATVIVDHFDTGGQDFGVVIPAGGGTVSAGQSVSASVLGGQRDLVITATGVDIAANETYFARVLTGAAGRLSISADSDVRGLTMVTWDGPGGDPYALNPNGLGGVDLTDNGTNSGFHLVVLFDDLPALANLRVYSNGSDWSQVSLNLPGQILSGNRVDFTIPFSSFTTGGGNGATFSSVGAVVLTVDAIANAGTDVTLDLLELDAVQEFGDLPDTYGTTLGNNGARHVILTGLRLGANIDAETDGFPSIDALGDNTNQAPPNDEDGVSRPANFKWTVGNWNSGPTAGGKITFAANGCIDTITPCYVYGWIDFNRNNVFDANEEIIGTSNLTLFGGGPNELPAGSASFSTANLRFNIPSGTTVEGSFYARFRICGGASGANDCGTPTGSSLTGEVEDYLWSFGPLAVTLESLTAQPTTAPTVVVALVGVSAAALIGVVLFVRRRKTA